MSRWECDGDTGEEQCLDIIKIITNCYRTIGSIFPYIGHVCTCTCQHDDVYHVTSTCTCTVLVDVA